MTGSAEPAAVVGTSVDDPDQLVMDILLTAEGRARPFDRYRQLREIAPVHKTAQSPMWFLTRYADCEAVLHDPRFGKPDPSGGAGGVSGATASLSSAFTRHGLVFLNPPDHTRLRALVSGVFAVRRVDALRARIEEITDTLVADIGEVLEVDAMDALALPLPITVIGELLGVPAQDRNQFRTVVRDVTAAMEVGVAPEEIASAAAAMRDMESYFLELVARRRREPADDLVSMLTRSADDGLLDIEELVGTLILLFSAGFETTTNLIGNGLNTFLDHPEAWALLQQRPDLVGAAVEEILRFESPIQVGSRMALEPAEIDSRRVEQGEMAVLFLGAANRDPLRFADPDVFDIQREPKPSLAFSGGVHYCLGAHLGRLEGRVVFERLLRSFAGMHRVGEGPRWRGSLVLHGLEELPVRFERR